MSSAVIGRDYRKRRQDQLLAHTLELESTARLPSGSPRLLLLLNSYYLGCPGGAELYN